MDVVVFVDGCSNGARATFRAELERLKESPDVVLDFSRLDFIDASCTNELARLAGDRLAAGLPPLTVVVSDGAIKRLLEVVGLSRELRLIDETAFRVTAGRALDNRADCVLQHTMGD